MWATAIALPAIYGTDIQCSQRTKHSSLCFRCVNDDHQRVWSHRLHLLQLHNFIFIKFICSFFLLRTKLIFRLEPKVFSSIELLQFRSFLPKKIFVSTLQLLDFNCHHVKGTHTSVDRWEREIIEDDCTDISHMTFVRSFNNDPLKIKIKICVYRRGKTHLEVKTATPRHIISNVLIWLM